MNSTAPALQTVVDAAVPVPGTQVFTYHVPDDLAGTLKAGMRVRIPFRNREAVGYAVQVERRETERELKSILGILDAEPVIQPPLLKLTRQISTYYGAGWGEAIENALPKWVKFGKSAERALKAGETEAPAYTAQGPAFDLTEEQRAAMEAIEKSLQSSHPKPILLHGVTGSGKSEIYIRAIRSTVSRGRSAICLVPEITLTEQIKLFFARHFGGELEILHSKLSDGERFLAWKRLESGKTRVVLGPRSALFAPVRDLGLIIMDEEHENSYKQETAPRYHARQVAVWRAANENALFVMGSATPSLEAMHASEASTFEKVVLKKRIDDRRLPEVNIVDLKEHMAEKKRSVMFSRVLQREIEDRLAKKEGVMLLLNRRGFSTLIQCPACGNSEACPSCQVSLTFHQDEQILLCHYCNYRQKVPSECSHCQSRLLRFTGFGTEKVESEAGRWFPQARIARLDADSIRQKGSHEKILGAFREKKIDILIGTQMIAKGFDFPHVTLVGVILADVGLMLPDFRSSERTFQLMTQVAGRAGRGTSPGKVIIQTFSPHHPSIVFARNHDFESFYRKEIEDRRKLRYPPFNQLINIIVRSKNENKAYQASLELGNLLRSAFKDGAENGLELIGPAPLPFYRLRGHYRWHIMIKCRSTDEFIAKIHETLRSFKKPSVVQTAVDVDPVNIL